MIASTSLFAALLQGAVLAPSGPWTANFETNMCLLGRKFGAGPDEVTISFRPMPVGETLEILMLRTVAGGRNAWNEVGQISISPDGPTFPATYKSWRVKRSRDRATFLYTKRAVLSSLDDAKVLTVDAGANGNVSVQPKGIAKALGVLEDCRRKLLTHWGVDPSEVAKAVTPPEPSQSPASWVRASDYPADALSNGHTGTTTVLWMIDENGSVDNCKVMLGSGSTSLDAAACKAIMKRGSYVPARDAAGRSVRSYDSCRVNWMIG